MVPRRPAHRALRPARLPRVASLGLVAATVATPFAAAMPALAAPAAPLAHTPLPATPLLPTIPLPTEPVATTPAPTTPLPTNPPRTTSTVTRWVTVASNVRSGPGTGYTIVGGLSAGTKVTGSYTSNGWFKLGEGRFVAGSLLTTTDPGGSTPPSSQTRWITAGANVRSGPGTSYAVVGSLAQGAEVTGSMTSNGWFDMGSGRFVYGQLTTTTPPGTTPPPAPAPGVVTGAMILTEAARYFGVPYLWGGSTPSGFDCSGYTSYVFAQLGISIPRTAAQQQGFTQRVTNPRPGDLVFFGTPAYHVGIYAGNNTMWDSAVPGTTIQLRQIWDNGNVTYGRVPGVSS